MRDEFAVHMLNDEGKEKARKIALEFSECLNNVEQLCGSLNVGRELAIVKTKMEEACFFAKKAMAKQKENQNEQP